MKQLLLIRHGKSDWAQPGLADHDRPLSERGLRDIPLIAEALLERGIAPDVILTSTAVRAATTAEMMAGAMGFPAEKILQVPGLYLAPPGGILRAVQRIDESVRTVLVFGHNPGMHETVMAFPAGEGIADFPTLAVARFEITAEHWGLFEWDSARLIEVVTPRGLPGGEGRREF